MINLRVPLASAVGKRLGSVNPSLAAVYDGDILCNPTVGVEF